MTRVLFICMGNICRSPAAEIIFRKMVIETGREGEFEIDSAGTIGIHRGNPPDPRMAAHLRKRGYTVAGCSRQLVADDLREFDILLTMDGENLADTLALDPSAEMCGSHEILRIKSELRICGSLFLLKSNKGILLSSSTKSSP